VNAKGKFKYEAGDEFCWQKNKNKILRMRGQSYKRLKKMMKANCTFLNVNLQEK